MVTRYEVDGWTKSIEEDSYKQGCLPDSYHEYSGSDTWTADTIEQLIAALWVFVPFPTHGDAVDLNACDVDGRIDISGHENAYGSEPTGQEWADWKRGTCKLYYVTYTFYVERVTRETVRLRKE